MIITGLQEHKETGREDVISNVNFGSFLTPQGQIVNSGSSWTHIFQLEGLFNDPIPLSLRENSMLTYNECKEIASILVNMYLFGKKGEEYEDSIDNQDTINLTSNHYEEILKLANSFNQQKNLIISAIDEDLDTVAQTHNPHLDLRDIQKERAKRSPFDFVEHMCKKLFGLGRKEYIQIFQQNQELLAQQVNTKFEQLVVDSQKLWSAN